MIKKHESVKEALDPHRLLLSPQKTPSWLEPLAYAALRTRRRFAMMRIALRVKWHWRQQGRLPERLEQVFDAAMPELPTKWFEGKPFKYTKDGRSFRIEAELSALDEPYRAILNGEDALPSQRAERRDEMRWSWGLSIKMELPPEKAGSRTLAAPKSLKQK